MKKQINFFFLLIIITSIISGDALGFTFNNNQEARFNDPKIKIYIADHACDTIDKTPGELANLASKAASLYWNTVNTSSLHLNVVGIKTLSDAFKTEGVCDVIFEGGGCQINQNMLTSDGIVISCNNSSDGNGFNSSILAVSLPNNTDGSNIISGVVLLNDTEDTQFNDLSEDDQVAVLAHELGHAFGLGHSSVVNSLMYFSTVDKRKTLGQDDRDAITYLYPPESNIANCATVSTKKNNQSILQFMAGLFIAVMLGLLWRGRKFL